MGKISKRVEKPIKSSTSKLLSTNVKPLKASKVTKNGPEKLAGKNKKKELLLAITKDLEENGNLPRSVKTKRSIKKKTDVFGFEIESVAEDLPRKLNGSVKLKKSAGEALLANLEGNDVGSSKTKKTKSKKVDGLGVEKSATSKRNKKDSKEPVIAGDVCEKYGINLADIKSAVDGVIKLHTENPKLKNQLFDESFPLSLTVSVNKIPTGYSKLFRVPLKHSLLTSDSEVCLIASEVKGIGNKKHEEHVEHYENLLAAKGVEGVKKIMTFHEFRTEHETFEQKSRLVDLYDAFLVCGKISGKVVKKCGKIFYKKRKVPVPVKLQATQLKTQFYQALSKSFFHVHLKGDNYNLQFGHSKMDPKHIVENCLYVIDFLNKNFPGGFENVKGLHVYAPRSTSIPIYMSTSTKVADLGKITTNTTKTKPVKACKGELTTLPNAEVIVKPSGQVLVKRVANGMMDEGLDENITDQDIIQANKEEDKKNKKNSAKSATTEKKVVDQDVKVNTELKKTKKAVKRVSEDVIESIEEKKVKNGVDETDDKEYFDFKHGKMVKSRKAPKASQSDDKENGKTTAKKVKSKKPSASIKEDITKKQTVKNGINKKSKDGRKKK